MNNPKNILEGITEKISVENPEVIVEEFHEISKKKSMRCLKISLLKDP